MGCNCGKRAGIKYQVKFADGTTKTVATVGDAQAQVRGKAGASFKAVKA